MNDPFSVRGEGVNVLFASPSLLGRLVGCTWVHSGNSLRPPLDSTVYEPKKDPDIMSVGRGPGVDLFPHRSCPRSPFDDGIRVDEQSQG